MATFQRLYTAAWYILDKVLTVFWHLEYLSCRKWSSLDSVCAHTESISVVRMKHLHHKCCHEGNIVLLLSTVHLSHTNPMMPFLLEGGGGIQLTRAEMDLIAEILTFSGALEGATQCARQDHSIVHFTILLYLSRQSRNCWIC